MLFLQNSCIGTNTQAVGGRWGRSVKAWTPCSLLLRVSALDHEASTEERLGVKTKFLAPQRSDLSRCLDL
jgi:hypothetical protein